MAQTWQRPVARFGPYVAAALLFLILPALLPTHLQSVWSRLVIFAIFAISLDIIFGYAGLISLGHSAFFGVGGYANALLLTKLGFESFWIVTPIALAITVAVAALFGLIALRVTRMYFLLITFALSQMLVAVAYTWRDVTGGAEGLFRIPHPDLGISIAWNSISLYYFACISLIICFFLMMLVVKSPFGLSLQGIRESEPRMQAMGYNVWLHKYVAYIISALFAGVAGIVFTYHNTVISPWNLGLEMSALALLICILGGRGTLWGPLIGAVVITLIEYFSSIYLPARWPLVLGGSFVLCVALLPKGIAPYLQGLWKRLIYGSAKN
jgi:branched-chain amino acid transport system permease protein